MIIVLNHSLQWLFMTVAGYFTRYRRYLCHQVLRFIKAKQLLRSDTVTRYSG